MQIKLEKLDPTGVVVEATEIKHLRGHRFLSTDYNGNEVLFYFDIDDHGNLKGVKQIEKL